MYLYYDKQLNLRTKIDHGEKIRQGSDFEVVLCLDENFEFETEKNTITATIKYNNNKIGNDIISERVEINAFEKLYPNENTSDLIEGVSYWMYYFKFSKDPYTLNSGTIVFNVELNYANEKDEIYKTLTFGSSELFVEKTVGLAKQNINLSNNFYNDIKEQLRVIDAKKANKNDLPKEKIVIVDGKPVFVSEELVDLIGNEDIEQNIEKINELLQSISEHETDLEVGIINHEGSTISSLRDTIWRFNENINFDDEIKSINLNFNSDGNSFSSITINKKEVDGIDAILYDENVVYENGQWIDILKRNVNILGGNDIDNINVIAWFYNNAELVLKPMDVVRYNLILSGNNLSLISSDGAVSTVALDFASKDYSYSKTESDKKYATSNDVNVLQNRIKALEEQEISKEGVTSRYVVNTVDSFNFNDGKHTSVHEGDLLLSFTDSRNNLVKAEYLKVGDAIYNKQIKQPDIWISEILEVLISETDLTGSKWQISEAFPEDAEEVSFDLNFTSNGEKFSKIVYSKIDYVGLAYITSSGGVVTAYMNSDDTWSDEEYQTIVINNGDDVDNPDAISWLKTIGALVNGGKVTYAVVSILESSLDLSGEGAGEVDLNDYYTKNEANQVFATKDELNELKGGTVDLSNYYKKTESDLRYARKEVETKVSQLEAKFSSDLTGSTWFLSQSFPEDINEFVYEINFTSGEESFSKISYIKSEAALIYEKSDGSRVTAYYTQDKAWGDEAYQTIVISGGTDAKNSNAVSTLKLIGVRLSGGINVDEDLTSKILALQGRIDGMNARLKVLEQNQGSNATVYNGDVKIEENNGMITFIINGVEYQAVNGMTWEEFVNSEYNVDEFYIAGGVYIMHHQDNSFGTENYWISNENDGTDNYLVEKTETIVSKEYYVYYEDPLGGGA